MESENTFVFSQYNKMMDASFSAFYNMKKSGELIDVTIRLKNRTFSAHRVILAAAIPYFRTLFTSKMAESEEEVSINELDPNALESLIDFAYARAINITTENAQSLLVASAFLQLTQIQNNCCDFLSKKFDLNNVMKVRALADSLNCLNLVKNADSYINKNFETFCRTKEFLNMPFPLLSDLIRKDDLQVSSEEVVFHAVMNWAKTYTERRKTLPDLLTGVRMTFLTPQFLINKASKEELIMNSSLCRNLLDEAKHYHLLPAEISRCSFTVSERCCGQRTGYEIYFFCCQKITMLSIFKYIPATGKWDSVLCDKSRFDLEHVLAVGGEIYVFRTNTFESFNPQTMTWASRDAYPSTHSSFKHAIHFEGKIVWFGNSQDGRQGFWFDIQRNQWQRYMHQNVRIYSDDELVPSSDILYILGGDSRFQAKGRRNEMYDLKTHTVFEISEMHNERSMFGSACIDDGLYVCGGIKKNRNDSDNIHIQNRFPTPDLRFCIRALFLAGLPANMPRIEEIKCGNRCQNPAPEILSSTEIYRPSQGWRTLSAMNIPRRNFSLVTYNKNLYAFGGSTKDADFIEFYDPAANKWTLVGGSLGDQYDFVKAVVISDAK